MAHLVDSNPFKKFSNEEWFRLLIGKNIRHVEQLAGLFYDSSGRLALELVGADLRGLESAIDTSLRGRGTSLEKLLTLGAGSEPPASVPFRPNLTGHAYGLNDTRSASYASFDSEVPERERAIGIKLNVNEPSTSSADQPTSKAGSLAANIGAAKGSRSGSKGNGNGGSDGNDHLPPFKSLLSKQDYPVPLNQYYRGTCVAFTGVSMIELMLMLKARQVADPQTIPMFSPQWLYFKAREAHNAEERRADGTIFQYALDALKESGVCREELWPYHHTPDFTYSSVFVLRKEFELLENDARRCTVSMGDVKNGPDVSVEWLKRRLVENKPVGIGVHVFKLAWDNPYTIATGEVGLPITRVMGGSERHLDTRLACHAITIVGYYDTEEGRSHRPGGGYFIFKNSWGTDWAAVASETPSGYGTIPYEYVQRYCTSAMVFDEVDWRPAG